MVRRVLRRRKNPEANKLQDRLIAVLHDGGLTVVELALWLDRPRATVATWVSGERNCSALFREVVHERLSILERLVRHYQGKKLIPPTASIQRRKKAMRGLIREHLGHFS